MQPFPETHDVTNILSDPLTEKHQLPYLHRLSCCTLVYLLMTENIVLLFSPTASVLSLTVRSYLCNYMFTSGHGQRRDRCLCTPDECLEWELIRCGCGI